MARGPFASAPQAPYCDYAEHHHCWAMVISRRSTSDGVRPAAVAGMFYPAQAEELRREVARLLDVATAQGPLPKALVVPHAGFMYSGAVAATAYARLRSGANRIRRVVLLGPSHRAAFRGLALPETSAFITPLGTVPLDASLCAAFAQQPGVSNSARAHALEHSLEVQLPFLQVVLGAFSLLPLVAGEARPAEIALLLDRAWGGEETLVVVSTDLSHFHDYETARARDEATCHRILALDATLDGADACGCVGLNGFLLTARRRGLLGRELSRCNSGDVTGDYSSVVGYAAFAFYEPGPGNA